MNRNQVGFFNRKMIYIYSFISSSGHVSRFTKVVSWLWKGRKDDNLEAIKKRFKVFVESTLPIVSYYESKGKLRKVRLWFFFFFSMIIIHYHHMFSSFFCLFVYSRSMLQNRARRFSRKLKIYFHLKLDKANEACARFIQTVFGIVINYYHCLVCLRRHRRLVIAEQNKTETFTCLVDLSYT